MACNLTKGLNVPCKDSIGGLKRIFFVKSYCSDIRANATFDGTDTNVMDTAGFANWDVQSGGAVTVFQYDLRPNLSSMTVNVNSDPATGTTFFEQTLSLSLQKLSVSQTNEIKLISYNRSQVFVLDNNDNLFLLGMDNGCDISGGTAVTGAAKGDMSGYTLELRAEEKDPLIWLDRTAGAGSGGTPTAKYPFDGLTDEAALTITTG
tara:strand:+ start:1127 stop:1744 length:618 start_codon:yes stop_codon:yes gene_type:complete